MQNSSVVKWHHTIMVSRKSGADYYYVKFSHSHTLRARTASQGARPAHILRAGADYYMGAGMVLPQKFAAARGGERATSEETMGAANAQQNLNLN